MHLAELIDAQILLINAPLIQVELYVDASIIVSPRICPKLV